MLGVQTFAEAFRGIVCHMSLALLATLISAAMIALMARIVAVPLRRVFGGGVVRIVLAMAMVGTGIVESFSKHTNGPPRIVQLPGSDRGATALPQTATSAALPCVTLHRLVMVFHGGECVLAEEV